MLAPVHCFDRQTLRGAQSAALIECTPLGSELYTRCKQENYGKQEEGCQTAGAAMLEHRF